MHRVIVLDNVAQEGLDLLDAAPGIEYEIRTGLKGDELRAALAEFDGAVCRSGVKITAEALEGNRRLRAVVRAGVGTDNIDKVAATRCGIVVMNTPTGNTLSTAEHTFALMLGLSRNVGPAFQSLQEGRWDRKAYMGTQLADKTLGVIGLGRVGLEVARRAQAFEMRVLGYDPFFSQEQANKLGIEKIEKVHDMLPLVDYLTVHTPLTPETRHLIGKEEIELFKPGVRLINAARGGIYHEAALAEGLKSGKVAGVALDVYEEEPCTDSPLFGMPGVLCTPHLGASTEEAQTQVAVEAVQLLIRYLSAGEIRHGVNIAAIDPKAVKPMIGGLNVAYRLGRLLAQWNGGAVSTCQLNYRGEAAEQDTKLLTASFCAGLLENTLDEEVNIVNAEMLMKERGVQMVESRESEMEDFSSSIAAELVADDGPWLAAGTLFGKKMPRLIRLGNYRLEAYLDGILFIFTHLDVPGIIGKVGLAFANHGINIAQMSVGREGTRPGGTAIGVLNLDSIPPQAALDDVLAIDSVQSVQLIELPPSGELPSWLQGLG